MVSYHGQASMLQIPTTELNPPPTRDTFDYMDTSTTTTCSILPNQDLRPSFRYTSLLLLMFRAHDDPMALDRPSTYTTSHTYVLFFYDFWTSCISIFVSMCIRPLSKITFGLLLYSYHLDGSAIDNGPIHLIYFQFAEIV